MRQRIMIAMALACQPKILIADEPTTALDVTVQAQIFDLMQNLQRETGAAIILITHDMGSVAEMAELSFAAEGQLFRALGEGFEHLSGALDYVRKVHMRPESHGGEYGAVLREIEAL